MKNIKLLVVMLISIIMTSTIANAADKHVKTELVERKTTVEEKVVGSNVSDTAALASASPTAASAITSTTDAVANKLKRADEMGLIKKFDLEFYAKNKRLGVSLVKRLDAFGLKKSEIEEYVKTKVMNDISIACLWCAKESAANAKATPVVTPSASPSPTSVASKLATPTTKTKSNMFAHYGRYDLLRVGVGVRLLNSYSQDQPFGFTTSMNDSGADPDYMAELKVWRAGLEYRLGHTVDLGNKFMGADIHAEKLITSNILIPKFYFVDGADWSGSLGLIIEQARVEGSEMIGGFKIPNTVQSVDYGVQLAGEYHLTSWASLRGAWEIGGPKITNTIPGVPDQTLQGTGRVLAMVIVGL